MQLDRKKKYKLAGKVWSFRVDPNDDQPVWQNSSDSHCLYECDLAYLLKQGLVEVVHEPITHTCRVGFDDSGWLEESREWARGTDRYFGFGGGVACGKTFDVTFVEVVK